MDSAPVPGNPSSWPGGRCDRGRCVCCRRAWWEKLPEHSGEVQQVQPRLGLSGPSGRLSWSVWICLRGCICGVWKFWWEKSLVMLSTALMGKKCRKKWGSTCLFFLYRLLKIWRFQDFYIVLRIREQLVSETYVIIFCGALNQSANHGNFFGPFSPLEHSDHLFHFNDCNKYFSVATITKL